MIPSKYKNQQGYQRRKSGVFRAEKTIQEKINENRHLQASLKKIKVTMSGSEYRRQRNMLQSEEQELLRKQRVANS